MKKEIISQNKEAIEDMKATLKELLPYAQLAVEEFEKSDFYSPDLKFQQILTDVDRLRNDHQKKLNREKYESLGLPFDENFALKLHPAPATPALTKAILAVNQRLAASRIKPEYFTISQGKVKISQPELKKFIDQHTLYAETEVEAMAFRHLKAVLEACTDFDEFIRENVGSMMFMNKLHPIMVARWFSLAKDGYTYKINLKTFQEIKRRLRK